MQGILEPKEDKDRLTTNLQHSFPSHLSILRTLLHEHHPLYSLCTHQNFQKKSVEDRKKGFQRCQKMNSFSSRVRY